MANRSQNVEERCKLMKMYNVKCSLSGSTDDIHAIFDWSVVCENTRQAVEMATEAWKDGVFTGFKVLEVRERGVSNDGE